MRVSWDLHQLSGTGTRVACLVLLVVDMIFRTCALRACTPRHEASVSKALFGSYIDANKAFEKLTDSDGGFNQGLGKETLLFEDEDLLVFNKPHNAQTAPGYEHDDSLASRVAKRYQLERVDQLVVHRLDYATSGVIVFARNVDALRDLHRQFRDAKKESERSSKSSNKNWTGGGASLYKQYSAIVQGCLPTYEGEVSLPLGPELESKPLWKVDPDGKESQTLWRVLAFSSTHTHVQLRPLTGRTHQLRIHMASIGHPILGTPFVSYRIIEHYQHPK